LKGFIQRWLINSVALFLAIYFIEDINAESLMALLLAGLVWGILNALIRPILVFLTLPLNIATLGLFTLVINGIILWLVSLVISGIQIESFSAALVGAILVSIFSSIISWLVKG
jgi:putative membrane protein